MDTLNNYGGFVYGMDDNSSFENLISQSLEAFIVKFGYKPAKLIIHPLHKNPTPTGTLINIPEDVDVIYNYYISIYALMWEFIKRTPRIIPSKRIPANE